MRADIQTPELLRRMAQLESTVGRLCEELGTLRTAVCEQGLQLPRPRGVLARGARSGGAAARDPGAQQLRGLAGATARGETARLKWVSDGLVVPGEQLAKAWGLTRQALAAAADRGEIFTVKIGNRLFYPAGFLMVERESVAAVCRALGELGASEKLMFWLREHGALSGKSVGAAFEAGTGLAKVERLASAWAHERGAPRVSEAA